MNNTFTFLKALGDIDEKYLKVCCEISEKEVISKRNKKIEINFLNNFILTNPLY